MTARDIKSESNFNCKSCDFKTNNRLQLKSHRVAEHLLAKVKSRSSPNTRRIKKEMESTVKSYKRCLKRAIKVSALKIKKEAVENVSVVGKYECGRCEKTFAGPASLRRHTRGIHGNGFKCTEDGCEFKATHPNFLKSHKIMAHMKIQHQTLNDFEGKEGDQAIRMDADEKEQEPKDANDSDKENQEDSKDSFEEPEEDSEEDDPEDVKVTDEKLLEEDKAPDSPPAKRKILSEETSPNKVAKIINLSEFYCDFCMFETDEEDSLSNHLAFSHFLAIFGV